MSVSVDSEGRRVRLDLNEAEATELLHLLRDPAGYAELGWIYLDEVARLVSEAIVASIAGVPVAGRTAPS